MKDPQTILVVDDDHVLRTGLKTVLQQRGFRTLGADDGMAAQRLIDGHRPDLVILDMMMPRWGGFLVLEHFRGKSGAPRFIMITANGAERHRIHAERAGVVDYIRKPFSMARLLEAVEKGLRDTAPTTEEDESDASSWIRCRCPGCGARIKAPGQLLGQTRACPRCSGPVAVQPQPPADEGPALVGAQTGGGFRS